MGIRTALVIGGGIAGPATALALHKAGIAATVYEAYPTAAHDVGGALSIAPNGLDALHVLGIDAALATMGQPINRMVLADGQGKPLAEFPGLRGVQPSLVMWRSELYRVLHERASASGINLEYGKRLVSVAENADGVSARFSDGTSANADILVGADGIHSAVRTLIDPQAPNPLYTGLLGFGGRARCGALGQPDAMYFAFGKRAFFGYWTAPDGGTMWFGNLPRDTPMTMAEARAIPSTDWLCVLRELYADDSFGSALIQHTPAEQLFVAGAGEALPPIPHWHRGRLVLVGDAAHAPSSSSGQGASLALESAVQLARCLRDVPDIPSAFAVYEQMRRPRVEKVAADAAKTNNSKAAGPLGKALMRFFMPLALKTVLTPEKMFGTLHRHCIDWNEIIAT